MTSHKSGEALAHRTAFVVETSTPDCDGTPTFLLQRAVATTETATSSDKPILPQKPPMGVILHGNFRELFYGASTEHAVDHKQESESEVDRDESFTIGFPEEQYPPWRIQWPAFARHAESLSTIAADLSGLEDYDMPPLV